MTLEELIAFYREMAKNISEALPHYNQASPAYERCKEDYERQLAVVNALEALKTVQEAAKPVELFVTLETKDEVDNWFKGMPHETPTMIAFMVGFNYAMHAIQERAKL